MERTITQTIKVSCLSCFLLILSHLPGSVLKLAPGYPPVPSTTFSTRLNYQPLVNLVPLTLLRRSGSRTRHCASAPLSNLYTGIKFRPLINLVPRSHQNSLNIAPGRQKAPHTQLGTGITSPTKVPGPDSYREVAGWLRQVPQPSFIAVMVNSQAL